MSVTPYFYWQPCQVNVFRCEASTERLFQRHIFSGTQLHSREWAAERHVQCLILMYYFTTTTNTFIISSCHCFLYFCPFAISVIKLVVAAKSFWFAVCNLFLFMVPFYYQTDLSFVHGCLCYPELLSDQAFCLCVPAVPGGYPSPCYQPDRRIQWQPCSQPDVQSTGHQRKTCKQSSFCPSQCFLCCLTLQWHPPTTTTTSRWVRILLCRSVCMTGCHLVEFAGVGLLSSRLPPCSSHALGGRQWGSYQAE